MKAPAFDYVRPQSLSEAVGLLAAGGGEARVVAGGQSLLALMNLRVASPALLIDIARLPELAVVSEDGDTVNLGAGITHAMIEDGRVPDPSRGLMPHVAAGLSYRAIRNRGTIGGSLALAGPAADWPPVFSALDAEVTVRGPNGRRAARSVLNSPPGVMRRSLPRTKSSRACAFPSCRLKRAGDITKLCRPSA